MSLSIGFSFNDLFICRSVHMDPGLLPESESVFWCNELPIGQKAQTNIRLGLLPEEITGALEKSGRQPGPAFPVSARSYE
jgi:hypothetical protein